MDRYQIEILDISVPLDAATTVYPGDPPPTFSWPGWTHKKGNPANVGFYAGGLHHGTHVDAPWHFIHDGKKLEEIPIDRWIGPVHVLDCRIEVKCITADTLNNAGIPSAPRRLLFKTKNGASDYWNAPFNPDFIYIDRSAAQWCVDHAVCLIGLDYLTIDPPSEPTFPAHHILLGNEVLILENIDLRNVAPGPYILHAAPAKLTGVDGGWCRAYLTR